RAAHAHALELEPVQPGRQDRLDAQRSRRRVGAQPEEPRDDVRERAGRPGLRAARHRIAHRRLASGVALVAAEELGKAVVTEAGGGIAQSYRDPQRLLVTYVGATPA